MVDEGGTGQNAAHIPANPYQPFTAVRIRIGILRAKRSPALISLASRASFPGGEAFYLPLGEGGPSKMVDEGGTGQNAAHIPANPYLTYFNIRILVPVFSSSRLRISSQTP